MARKKKTMGTGALISVLANRVHPSKYIREKHRNIRNGMRLIDCWVIRREVKKISRKDQEAIVFSHNDYVDDDGTLIELHAVIRFCKILQEGPPAQFFVDNSSDVEDDSRQPLEQGQLEIPREAHLATNSRTALADIIVELRNQGFSIDDDNAPAPENVPVDEGESLISNNSNNVMKEWGHNGLCYRKVTEARDCRASLKKYCTDEVKFSKLQYFEMMIPKQFIVDVMLVSMNQKIQPGADPISYGEFLKFLGLRFLMATVQGPQYREYWSEKPISMFVGAPFRIFDFMSRARFDIIVKALRYTNEEPPDQIDRFWEVRSLLKAWNSNMETNFSPSWISCLDESLSKWIQRCTCPGWVFCPRKPWPFGNEYHTIACGDSGILFFMEIVEGKDHPRHIPVEHENLGRTVGLMVRCTKSLHATGKVVVLDSGFCVLKGIVELKKRGVFAVALIEKRRY